METHSSVLVQRIPIDRGAWWATHGVTKGWTWLSTAQHIYWSWTLWIGGKCQETWHRPNVSWTFWQGSNVC